MGRKFPEVTRDEFRAIDAVYDAYMAFNAADSHSAVSGVVPTARRARGRNGIACRFRPCGIPHFGIHPWGGTAHLGGNG
jgi:hypothetical protein